MGDALMFIKQRHVRNCYKADPEYGAGVAEALKIDLEDALIAGDPVEKHDFYY
jgi:catalase